MEPTAEDGVSRDQFRDVIGRFTTGVTVITAHDGMDHGMTASAVSSLSLDPPMLLVCINRSSRTGDAVHSSGRFTVNVLADDQADLAHRFSTPADDRFAGVATTRGPIGTLALAGALAHIDCSVADDVSAATHRIVLGRVEHAIAHEGAPLAYFRGQFGQLHPARDDAVTLLLRERVLGSDDDVDLDRDRLAADLDTDRARVDRALAALRAEGLVVGDPHHGYRPAPVDLPAIDEALDARHAIELGAVQLALDRVTVDDIALLRRLAHRTVELFTDHELEDVAAYAGANTEFHEALVRLSGSRSLLDAYRGLSLAGILVRGLRTPAKLAVAHAEDHLTIAAALADGSREAISDAIQTHTERSRMAHHEAAASARAGHASRD